MSCQSCAEKFPTFQELKTHCRVRQHAYFLFKCGGCEESYQKLADLDQHMKIHGFPGDSLPVEVDYSAVEEVAPTSISGSIPGNFEDNALANVSLERVVNVSEEISVDGYESMSSGISSYGTIGSLSPPLSPIPSINPPTATENGSIVGDWDVVSPQPISRLTSVSPVPLTNEIAREIAILSPEVPERFNIVIKGFFIWTCPLCPRSYPTKHGLEKHQQRTHSFDESPSDVHNAGAEKISVEGGFFDTNLAAVTLDTADDHLSSASNNALICPLCGKELGTPSGLKYHLDSSTNAHCFFRCSSCPRKFLTPELLSKHCVNKHLPEEIHNVVSPSIANVQQGPKILIPRQNLLEQPSLKCRICGKKMANKSALSSHEKSGAKAHRIFKCSSCKAAYLTQEKLNAHRKSSHSGTRIESISSKPSFVCDICGKEFEKKKALKSHRLSEAQSHSTWKCSVCDRVFIARLQLEQHQQKKHRINPGGTPVRGVPATTATKEEGRTFGCLICPSSFSKPSAVAHHLESGCHSNFTRHHITSAVKALGIVPQITVKQITGPVPPPKPIAAHTATSSTWNGSKFKCFLCSKGFASLGGLNSHLNSAAHDDKEFKCPKCKHKFILISALVQHLESGTCGLTQAGEIINFYDGLSAKFSNRLLIA